MRQRTVKPGRKNCPAVGIFYIIVFAVINELSIIEEIP